MNFKKNDIVSYLLWIFISLSILLFIYIKNINNQIEEFSVNNNSLFKLKSLNRKFNTLFEKKGNFINYDIVNKEIKTFDTLFHFLMIFSKKANLKSYEQLIKNIEIYYKIKLENIEYFKSESSQFLYSVHYLYRLNNHISKADYSYKVMDTSNKIILEILKYFMNIPIDKEKITTNLEYLRNNINQNKLIKSYIDHVTINLKRIEKFNEIKKKQKLNNLENALEEFHQFLTKNHQKNIFIEKTIVTALFTLALMVLIMLLFRNREAKKLREKLLGFRTAIDNSYNSIIITNLDNNIVYVNERTEVESGYSKEELIGHNPRILQSGYNNKEFYLALHEVLRSGKKWEGDFINRRKNGSLLYEKASIIPIYQNRKIVNYLAIKSNITNYIEAKQKVEYMAYHDSLTALPNRLSIDKYLESSLLRAKENNFKVGMLLIDIDRFKTINDTLGHNVGDEILIECANRMKRVLLAKDVLARVGGDEFLIILNNTNQETLKDISKKLIDFFKHPIKTKRHLLGITLSIGISMFPDDDSEGKKLFKYADIAMYKAKYSGRNRYQFYKKSFSLEANNNLQFEQSLQEALSNNELYLMYQPQYTLKDKNIVGIEALIRWQSPKLGLVSPEKFIPIAEDTGLIIDIGLFVFKKACKDFLVFKEYSKTLKDISINVSAIQLYQNSFFDNILMIIEEVGITPKCIKIEITETHIMKDIKKSITILEDLRKIGFQVSIDDFGTGHSSLKYLKEFPINELKIDKTFIDDLPFSANNVAISKSILALSASMGYINVAEGIENKEQEDFLREHHCLIGQGYYFSKPQRKEDLISFFKKIKSF